MLAIYINNKILSLFIFDQYWLKKLKIYCFSNSLAKIQN